MLPVQPGITAHIPLHARYLNYRLKPGTDAIGVLKALATIADGDHVVVGLGMSLVTALRQTIPGLSTFTALTGIGVDVPSTPHALWIWLREAERGTLIHQQRKLDVLLVPAFERVYTEEGFYYQKGRDLSGYEDGTENPQGDDIIRVAALTGKGNGLDGSSFVAVQHWIHDLNALAAMSPHTQDEAIGRRRTDNEEMDDAPVSAHVKRTAQESFTPEAFVWRRSMPTSDINHAGFMFTAFASDFYAFEAQLKRMIGLEDGIIDGLFSFSRPVNCAYYWCPPMQAQGGLDLSALNIN